MKHTAFLIAGLAYGDEGKGTISDFLSHESAEAPLIVRYNGGAQAGHNVVLEDGKNHVFAQFGSGMFRRGALTFLSKFMLIEPIGMMYEARQLKQFGLADIFEKTFIDREAPLITPFHIAANRILESSRGNDRHGSCGLGIGETVEDLKEHKEDAPRVKDLDNFRELERKLKLVRERKLSKTRHLFRTLENDPDSQINIFMLEAADAAEQCLRKYSDFKKLVQIRPGGYLRNLIDGRTAIFEGAQGMLLHPAYGSGPHVTKTDTTFRNAEELLKEAGCPHKAVKVGVLRGYFTRHGAGPFPTEDKTLSEKILDAENKEHPWQGKFRVGFFDETAAKYAIECIGGIDLLALTNLDRLREMDSVKSASSYSEPDALPKYRDFGAFKTKNDARFYAEELSRTLSVPLWIMSFGPKRSDKIFT